MSHTQLILVDVKKAYLTITSMKLCENYYEKIEVSYTKLFKNCFDLRQQDLDCHSHQKLFLLYSDSTYKMIHDILQGLFVRKHVDFGI